MSLFESTLYTVLLFVLHWLRNLDLEAIIDKAIDDIIAEIEKGNGPDSAPVVDMSPDATEAEVQSQQDTIAKRVAAAKAKAQQ